MGFEYKIKLSSDDFSAFENDIAGETLDAVLRSAPGFVETDGEIYKYSATNNPAATWLATVHVEPDGLWLTLYEREPLCSYLMNAVLRICGRLNIEDG